MELQELAINNRLTAIEAQLNKITRVLEQKYPGDFAGEAETISDPELNVIDLRSDNGELPIALTADKGGIHAL